MAGKKRKNEQCGDTLDIWKRTKSLENSEDWNFDSSQTSKAIVKIVEIRDIQNYVSSLIREPAEEDVIASGTIDVCFIETRASLRNKVMEFISHKFPDHDGGFEFLHFKPDISPYMPSIQHNSQYLSAYARIEVVYVRLTDVDLSHMKFSASPERLPWASRSNGMESFEEAGEANYKPFKYDIDETPKGKWKTDIEDPIRILMSLVNKNFKGFVAIDHLRDKAKKIAEDAYFNWLDNNPRRHPGHIVIVGNPGVGKTTGAIALANFLTEASLVLSGNIIEAQRDDLIDKYVGGTELKTNDVIQSARGGVVIFDEIYTLYKPTSPNDTGKEALTTIMKHMTDDCAPVFMFLGYKDHMKDFVNMNPGFQRRIRYTIEMQDYSCKDLAEIVDLKLKELPGVKTATGLTFERYFIDLPQAYLKLHNASVSVRLINYAIESARQRVLALHFKERKGATVIKEEDFDIAFHRIKKESEDANDNSPPVSGMYM